MNTNKLKQMIKNYGFYAAVGLVAVGAVVAVFVFPNDGKVEANPNSYVPNKETTSRKVEDSIQKEESFTVETNVPDKAKSTSNTTQVAPQDTPAIVVSGKETIVSENFNSTTLKEEKKPYFAQGDTLSLPIKGEIVVPYTDDSTKHWFSKALNQTMRTYGICIAGKEGEAVKAAAKGTVVDIIKDSSTLKGYMPSVGVEVVVEHGNGIQTKYGLQNGKAYEDLLGKLVEAGDPIGEVGKPSGAFIREGANVYFQVVKDGTVVNPSELLAK